MAPGHRRISMKAIKATWHKGRIIPYAPVDWPEGCRLVVAPDGEPLLNGAGEDAQADDSQSIAKWLADFDAIPPWQMTPKEEAEWHVARQAVKDYTLAKMKRRFGEEKP